MPKVVIDNNSGITQARGRGFQQLSESSKGFVREVQSASVSSGIASGDISSGILIPANACIEYLSIRVGTLYANGSGDRASLLLNGYKFSGDVALHAADGGTAAGIQLHTDGTPATVGDTFTYNIAAAAIAGNTQDIDLLAPSISSSSQTELTLTMVLSGGAAANADDTQAVVEVLVQYVVPKF